jgi:triphosphatase
MPLETSALMRHYDWASRHRVIPMSPPREIELKLDVPTRSLPRLTGSTLLNGAAMSARKPASLVSTYFDTNKLKLRRKGLSLRVRQIGRRLVQTVKQENGAGGALLVRGEWDHDIDAKQPDLDAMHDTALAPVLNKKLKRSMKPVFETRVRRKVFQIQSGDSEVELSLDTGTVEAGRKSSPLCEVELELKQGQVIDLFRLAKKLAQEVPAQLAVKSKADRGYALLTGEKAGAVKAVPIGLVPDTDVQSAFQIIARACLHQLLANEPVMLGAEPEGLHQMRVALRRLRAAISLFSDMLTDPQTNALKAELKWIAGELGPARQLDVFLKRVLTPVADRKPHRSGVAVLLPELRQKREDAFARARAAVESPRFRGLVIDTTAWIESGDWMRNPDDLASTLRQRSLAATAAEQLRRRRKSILKRGKHLDQLDSQRRHRLRIQAKKLRYAAEFFAGAFPGKKSSRRREYFVTSLEKLQDALGDLNDIAVHESLSEQLVNKKDHGGNRRGGRVKKAFVAGRLVGREEARIAPLLKAAEEAYEAFSKAKLYW